MIQFLTMIFDWLAGFAMMSLGLTVTDADVCAVEADIIPVQYVVIEQPIDVSAQECISSDHEDAEPVEVFRI